MVKTGMPLKGMRKRNAGAQAKNSENLHAPEKLVTSGSRNY